MEPIENFVTCDHASRCMGGMHPASWNAPKPEGETFNHRTQIQFLKQGDRILVKDNARDSYRLAVAAMDGHAVSENYGLRVGNEYFAKNAERDYINVHYNGVTYPQRKKLGGTSYDQPNETIMQKDVTVYVTKQTAARIRVDKKINANKDRLAQIDKEIHDWTVKRNAAQITVENSQSWLDALTIERRKLVG